MANGDLAAADGMATVASTGLAGMGYDEINKSRDYIAGRMKKDFSNVAGGAVPVANGGTGATTAANAITNLGIKALTWGDANLTSLSCSKLTGTLPSAVIPNISAAFITSGTITRPVATTGSVGCAGMLQSEGARGNQVTSNYVSAYMDGSGYFGYAPSVRSTKQNITPWALDLDTFKGLGPVSFRYRKDVRALGDDAPTEVGFIADDFHAAGLDWLTFNDPQTGKLAGLHYERVAVALWSVVRQQQDTIDALTARVAALEDPKTMEEPK